MELTFDLRTTDGHDISVMQQIIQKRVKELGETSKQACVAMTINILRSLRADTKRAKQTERPTLKIVDISAQYTPSWEGKAKERKRVLRAGKNGAVVSPKYVKWICGKYFKGQEVHTYHVIDEIADSKTYEYILVADNMKQAEQEAKRRHRNRIKMYSGLAKCALGLAMHKTYSQQNVAEDVNQQTKEAGDKMTDARVVESGFDGGDVSIHVEDNLKYATDALKTGEIDTTIEKALNKMVGYINHKLHQKGIYDDIKIPSRELLDK